MLIVFNVYYVFTFSPFPDAQPPFVEGVSSATYDNQIEKARMRLKNVTSRLGVPSFSIAIGHNNQLIWTAVEGYQDIETNTTATPKTAYRIGSTSKTLTATAIAKEIQNKRLFLDHPIKDTIVNWEKKRWDFSLRQLLSHTAGFFHYQHLKLSSLKYTLCNCYEFKSATHALKVFNNNDLLYEPGTRFSYSSFDINLASAILEQKVEMPFPEYMKTEIFMPLEMHNTYADHSKPKTPNLATFYEMEKGYYREFQSMGLFSDVNLSYKWAGGGFISTPSDLVKLGNAWINDTLFIQRETKKTFWTPVKLKNGEINPQEYALGWRSYLDFKNDYLEGGEKSYWIVHHGGVSKGSQNFLVLFPNYNLVVDASINANITPFSKFFAEVMQIIAPFVEQLPRQESGLYADIKEAL